ncbi:MAG: tyrosine-protein phosphatase [Acidobacteriota bacterium]
MIDIHSHVLPGLDDGARTLEQAVEMLRTARRSGTTDIVASPHANIDFRFDPAVVNAKIAELQTAAGPEVRIHRGCDFHLYFDNIQDALEHPARYTIAGGPYLLVEFPDLLIARNTREIFARLAAAGITPIVTHPERNYLLHTRIDQLSEWVEQGCLVQVTGQSFLGRFGTEARRVARGLMRRGLVHFVASDAHDDQDRTPRLDDAYAEVAGRYGEERAQALFVENPRAVIQGEPLPEQPEPDSTPGRKWYQFWVG